MDIEKIYDMIYRKKIIKILELLNLRGNIFIFIKNFLKTRNLRVKLNNILSENEIE